MKTRSKSQIFKRRLPALAACIFALGQAQADSLWTKETAVSLYADHKANRVGDIITVLVMESNSASRNSSTKTEKKSDLSASISSFVNGNFQDKLFPGGGATVQKPELGTTSQTKFEGKGAVNNSGTLNSRFAVRVVDVLPNKNLIIEGVRRTSFSGESQTIVLRGTVRPQDVTPVNTVYSYHLADVSIALKDKGTVSDVQKKGWFSKLWGKISPF
ncbi:MAG: flagellar basal body L-ring protein FlgH [Verrucomicrobia bacterium]|nr:flagellar basal body L-ring protein FlgH [Verrucomicrobiota bacterium]